MNKVREKVEMKNARYHSKDIWKCICAGIGESHYDGGLPESIIIFVLEGSLVLSTDKYKDYIVSAGSAAFIPSNSSYKLEALENLYCISCSFNIDSLLSADCSINELKLFCQDSRPEPNLLEINRSLSLFLKLMKDYLSEGDYSYNFYNNKKQELFCLFFARYSRQDIASFLHPIIGEGMEFREFIFNNYLKISTIREFASLANYSKSGFIKRFQRYFNESPYKWMLHQKAERVRVDIEAGNLSFQEIAVKHGFNPYGNFVLFCKKYIGFTPSKISGKK